MKERIFLSPPHMGVLEQQFVRDAFESNYIAPLGPQVDAFEKAFSDYTGIPHCVALVQRDGRHASGVEVSWVSGPGDEVFGSTLTFIGSVSPVVFEGASVVLVDCDRTSWNMDPDLLARELAACDRKAGCPRRWCPPTCMGSAPTMGAFTRCATGMAVPVIVDAAEAMGARYGVQGERRHAGAGARAAVFSFNGNKIMTTSGGGMLASEDKTLDRRTRAFCPSRPATRSPIMSIRDRVQLPHEQCAGRHRAGAAGLCWMSGCARGGRSSTIMPRP
jgi:dTDP-4-amino-4,6-dideoxygalactose transaminase